MLIAKELPRFLWPEAVAHAVYLQNRAPTHTLNNMMPHEAWTSKKPNISYFREFRCDVWILIKGDHDKLSPKSQKFIFTGWQEGPKAIHYYNPQYQKTQIS